MTGETVALILKRFGLGEPVHVEPAAGGKVHDTVYVETGGGARFVVQKLAPPFDAAAARDVYFLTQYLTKAGFPAPVFLLSREGEPYVRHNNGLYRVMPRMPGTMKSRLDSNRAAGRVARLVGRLHRLLERCPYTPTFRLAGLHDPEYTLEKLSTLASRHPSKADPVQDLIRNFTREIPRYLLPDALPPRRIHGDLKLANFLWDEKEHPCALLDYDTFMVGTYPMEMADAFRSWFGIKDHPSGPRFEPAFLQAAWTTYLQAAPPWTAEEKQSLLRAIPLLFLELGARYLIDYFEERFFAWDPTRFASRAEHNRARVLRQWLFFRDVRRKEAELAEALGVHL